MIKNRVLLFSAFAFTSIVSGLHAQNASFHFVPLSPTSITAGDTLQLQVNLLTDSPSVGAGFYLNEPTNSGFAILNIDRSDSPYTDFVFTTSEITTALSGNNLLNSRNDSNLGGLVPNFGFPVTAGLYNLGRVTISSNGVLPGTYSLGIGPAANLEVLSSTLSNFASIGTSSINVTVSSVPEPCSFILVASAAVWLSYRCRLSQRSNKFD